MKQDNGKSRRVRIIAAACSVLVLAGGSAGIYAFCSGKEQKPEQAENTAAKNDVKDDSGIISAGGTVQSSQLSDTLGMKNTSVRLTVDEVLAEAGDSVKEGTELYRLTEDSLSKAESTLNSELKSAENALTKQKTTAQSDKIKAETLYQSELLLKDTAQAEYDEGIASLDSKLKTAYDDYTEAQSTVNKAPSEISQKQSQLNMKQSAADSLSTKKTSAEKALSDAGTKYSSAADSYNSLVTGYNSAASVVRYLGTALGKDVSGVTLAQNVTAQIQEQISSSSGRSGAPAMSGANAGAFDGSSFDMSQLPSQTASEFSTAKMGTADAAPQMPENMPSANAGVTDITQLYENAYREYTSAKEKLDKAGQTFTSAEKDYKSKAASLSEVTSELKEAQESVSSLEKEISSLQSALSKAKSNLTKLKSEYNSLKNSYETDKLELRNKYDTDMATCENAEFNYKLTCNTIESELAEKQSAYDTAAENLRIFEEELSDGYILAKQDGTVYSLSGQAGRNIDVSSAFVYYVDRSDLTVTVELDQYDVTQIEIGDTVMIYSSETGVQTGKITAISAGESTSLADVNFNVKVTADSNTRLYSGQSVNVYFNYSSLGNGDFSDFSGGSQGSEKSGSGEGRPSFGGRDMPSGFDPSNMPDGFDFSNMPDFGGKE